MENPLKDCLTIQVSEEDVNSPDFDLANYMNKKIKKALFKVSSMDYIKQNRKTYTENEKETNIERTTLASR